MVRTSISVPAEILEEFDDLLWDYQTEKVLPRERMRSALIAQLMMDWVENHDEWMEEHEDWIAEQWEGKGNEDGEVVIN
jgi:metal-responsive CopG/Arc/MetJ family transcriptional regulator